MHVSTERDHFDRCRSVLDRFVRYSSLSIHDQGPDLQNILGKILSLAYKFFLSLS